MKMKNKVPKAPKKAPKAHTPLIVETKTILEIVSISVKDIPFTKTNDSPEAFLRKSGFVSIFQEGGHIIASTPTTKDDMIVIEYISKPGEELRPCRLVRIYQGKPIEIETGRVLFILSVKSLEISELIIEGEREILNWELKGKPVGISAIPEISFCADEIVSGGYSDLETASPSSNSSFVPGHAETSTLSTATSMIADLVKRIEELSADRLLSVVSPDTISKFQIKPIVSEKTPISVKPNDPPPPTWQNNKYLLEFMDEHCAGSRQMIVLSVAFNKLVEEGDTAYDIAKRLGEYPWAVSLIMSVADRLHPDLWPLLDISSDCSERITLSDLRMLIKFPIGSQVSVWNIAKKRLKRADILASLKVLGSCVSGYSVV